MHTINDYLNHWAQKQPNKRLYIFLNIKGETTESYTYEKFRERVDIIASNLLAENRLKKGDRVLLIYPPGLEIIAAFFACAKIGLLPVPIAPPMGSNFFSALKKMQYILKDCAATGILTSRKYQWFFQLNLTKQKFVKWFTKATWLPKLYWVKTDDFVIQYSPEKLQQTPSKILFLQYTSGSTSQPKGVIVTHKNIIENGKNALQQQYPIGVTWLPQFHDMGLIGGYLFVLMHGGTTYGFSPADFMERPLLWLETITKVKATLCSAPNFAYEYCLRKDKITTENLATIQLSSLKFLMTAAEPVRASTFINFFQRFKTSGLKQHAYAAAYGLAENALGVTTKGRKILSLNKQALSKQKIQIEAFSLDNPMTTQLVSCGKAIKGINIKIVDPKTFQEVANENMGEIWVKGTSKCLGYWNKPILTEKNFNAQLANQPPSNNDYLRTGDLGFMHQGELFISSRLKDLLIIHGVNYYPQDIELIVEKTAPEIRKGSTTCFSIEQNQEEQLIVIAEVKHPERMPSSSILMGAIRLHFNIQPSQLVLLPPKTVPKTSSGKLARNKCKKLWLAGQLPTIRIFRPNKEIESSPTLYAPLDKLKKVYQLTGTEDLTLFEIGMDSLAMVNLIGEIKNSLQHANAFSLAKNVDIRLFQNLTVAELFDFMNQLSIAPKEAIAFFQQQVTLLREELQVYEGKLMEQDKHLPIMVDKTLAINPSKSDHILLTGGTGFLGPYLLYNLLTQTNSKLYVLVRAKNEQQAKIRLKKDLIKNKLFTSSIKKCFQTGRVVPICGDLAKPKLGLSMALWKQLTHQIDTIYHNGALVNYVQSYEALRPTNVLGTRELLDFATTHHLKVFNYISTTFIYGWSVKSVLREADCNREMNALDFGYSQSKWVAEQLVLRGFEQGLPGRIFRPALITPSQKGKASSMDITLMLFAFIINHSLSGRANNQTSLIPVDIVAKHIVGIARLPKSMNKTFHVTADYTNLPSITKVLSQLLNQDFELKSVHQFTEAMTQRCTPHDLIYPLLDFFVRSADNIAAMEFKRYDKTNYENYLKATAFSSSEINLRKTIKGILLHLQERGIIDHFQTQKSLNHESVMDY